MLNRILFVDDDVNLLAAMKRQFRTLFEVETANSGKNALLVVKYQKPFSVVISDMQMPEMNGIEFLHTMRSVSPNTVRLMLTGKADLQTALAAVNEGNIFRIITKPSHYGQLKDNIDAAIIQHSLITAEKVLLERTLLGAVSVMFQMLSLTVPEAFGRANLVQNWVQKLPDGLVDGVWKLKIAAMLSPLGMLMIPPDILATMERGEELSDKNQKIIACAPKSAYDLIVKIPRLKTIADIVLLQDRGFDGTGFPLDGPKGKAIPEQSRALKILQDLSKAGTFPSAATFAVLDAQRTLYDPDLLQAIRECLLPSNDLLCWADVNPGTQEMALIQLVEGDILAANLELEDGQLVLAAGSQLSQPVLDRLINLGHIRSIREPILIQLPSPPDCQEPESVDYLERKKSAESDISAMSQSEVIRLLDSQIVDDYGN